jgi:hypothetical protein
VLGVKEKKKKGGRGRIKKRPLLFVLTSKRCPP